MRQLLDKPGMARLPRRQPHRLADSSLRVLSIRGMLMALTRLFLWLWSLVYVANRIVATHASKQARATLKGQTLDNLPIPERIGKLKIVYLLPELSGRFGAHALVVFVTICALALPPQISTSPTATRHMLTEEQAGIVESILPAKPIQITEELLAPAQSGFDLSSREVYRAYHMLVEGETLGDVAAQYGVSVASIYWANLTSNDGILAAGQELRIPRVSGIPYIVQPADTLTSIAATLGVSPEAISLFAANHVQSDADLEIGQELFVPGGVLDYPRELLDQVGGSDGIASLRAVVLGSVYEDETNLRGGPGRAYPTITKLEAGMQLMPVARHERWILVEAGTFGSGWVRSDLIALSEAAITALPETNDFPPPPPRWVWPTYGRMTSPFGWRTVPFRSFHDGLDIANRAGTQILAARRGVVYEAGWCRGFGYCVKIDHGDGLTTIYGHLLKKPVVAAGDQVEAGDLIGAMGSTYDRAGGGYSTGVHLHFTVKLNGKAVNPMQYLP